MAEDDEIDVLGDFNLDLLTKNESTIFDHNVLVSQNSDLLNCDYTIHPQWLLDKPSTNPAEWYNTSHEEEDEISIDNVFDQSGNDLIGLSTENSISDESGWTEKEKNLLNRGIEIFGSNSINLSQFIGSKSPSEVKYFMKNFYSDMQLNCAKLNQENLFDFNYVEETVVTTSDMQSVKHQSDFKTKKLKSIKRNQDLCYDNVPSGQSLLKSTYTKVHSPKKAVKVKFKTKLKIKPAKSVFPKEKTKVRKRILSQNLNEERTDVTKNLVTVNTNIPKCIEGQVIKIQKEDENDSSDLEIDIEDDECEEKQLKIDENVKENVTFDVNIKSEVPSPTPNQSAELSPLNKQKAKKQPPSMEELTNSTIAALTSEQIPEIECILQDDEISDVEKYLFHEFFEERRTKTPARYLRIRNHILNAWTNVKPNYVTKTSIRQGLKQCGDVNCIGRIHTYLEQIGAINFGCEQVSYIRPLSELVYVPTEKAQINNIHDVAVNVNDCLLPKQRIRKKFVNDGEGGYTLTHNEIGEVINTTVINEEPVSKYQRYVQRRPTVPLIYCRPFTESKQQNFKITIDLSTLLLMDLHAHMYLSEVMGLIGGKWDQANKLLAIKRYEPCRNIARSSHIHCDMCPIAQAQAAELLHRDAMHILGWYHSHPTFAPEPSQQDLETQQSVQQWIGNNQPCVGFILTPFSVHGALISSPFRCLMVDRKENFDDQFVPYKFHVDIYANDVDIDDLLRRARRLIEYDVVMSRAVMEDGGKGGGGGGVAGLNKNRIDFMKLYFMDQSITYLDKFIYSVKMNLAKCSNINKMTCDAIIEGLTEVCRQIRR